MGALGVKETMIDVNLKIMNSKLLMSPKIAISEKFVISENFAHCYIKAVGGCRWTIKKALYCVVGGPP